MATIQEQYAELIKQGQDAALAALENWNRTFQQALGQLATIKLISPEQVIDQVYDFTGLLIHAQRDYAKQAVAAGTAAAERVRGGMAQSAGAATQG
jgi:hypothetical protein